MGVDVARVVLAASSAVELVAGLALVVSPETQQRALYAAGALGGPTPLSVKFGRTAGGAMLAVGALGVCACVRHATQQLADATAVHLAYHAFAWANNGPVNGASKLAANAHAALALLTALGAAELAAR